MAFRRSGSSSTQPPGGGPQANRVAVWAVLATAFVGVAAPVVTWQATRDVQKDAARETRFQNDLSELRTVLDNALTNLNVVRMRVEEKERLWLAHVDGAGELQPVLDAHRKVAAAIGRARADGARLRIRLGQRGIFNLYWFAYHEYVELDRCTPPDVRADLYKPEARKEAVRKLRLLGIDYSGLFSDVAFLRVQSRLPGDQPQSPVQERIDEGTRIGNEKGSFLTTCLEALDAETGVSTER
jgi:hypothetical protein